jgi:hypothetical protein
MALCVIVLLSRISGGLFVAKRGVTPFRLTAMVPGLLPAPLENHGARITRPHAGGLVGVETADSRTGDFSHNLAGSLRQSLTTGAPWRAQTAPREARAGLIAFTPNMAPGMRRSCLL